ncbi:MAG TPA: rhodanese-like domain-containing protein [Steroidobacteraceae bacterium]
MNAIVKFLVVAMLATCTAVFAETATIAPDTLAERIEKKDAELIVIDVRTPQEFASGHVPGALNIPHDQLPNRIAELVGAKDKDIVVYCRSGRRAALAQQALAEQGFKRVLHLEGDIVKWQDENRPVEK